MIAMMWNHCDIVTSSLLSLVVLSVFMNIYQAGFLGSMRMTKIKSETGIASLNSVYKKYSQVGFHRSGVDMIELATTLDNCYKNIKFPKKMPAADLDIIRKAHRDLKKMIKFQKGLFNGAYKDVAWEVPAKNRCEGTDTDKRAYAMAYVTKMSLNEELDDVEELVSGLLENVLKLIGYYPDSKKRPKIQKPNAKT